MRKRIFAAAAVMAFAAAAAGGIFGPAASAAEAQPAPYRLDLGSAGAAEKLLPHYIPVSLDGRTEALEAHWTLSEGVLTRVRDVGSPQVTENYAALYFEGCSLRWFEMSFRLRLGSEAGLAGVVFGSSDMTLRHMASGNALYFQPDPNVELSGSTLTVKATSAELPAAAGFYDVNLSVSGGRVRVNVDGREVLRKEYPEELFARGRIALFTANTGAAFAGPVEIWNLDGQGNRIPLDGYVPATGVEIEGGDVKMMLSDEPVRLRASVIPENATQRGIRWLAEVPDVAAVDGEGFLHPLKEGSTVLYAVSEDGNFRDSCTVTVERAVILVEQIVLDQTSYSGTVGDKFYLTPSILPENAENDTVIWRSSDTRVAMVNNGTVTLVGEGTCTITVKDGSGAFSAACQVTSAAGGDGCKRTGRTGAAMIFLAAGAAILGRMR